MSEDITKIYEEYSEELLFCKYYIAEKLRHHAEMGNVGKIFSRNVSKKDFKCSNLSLVLLFGPNTKALNVILLSVGKTFIEGN